MVQFWPIIFWLAVVFTAVMVLIPSPPAVPYNPSDKLQHITAFATLTALGSKAYRPTPWARLFGGLIIFGALIKLLQELPFIHRGRDPAD